MYQLTKNILTSKCKTNAPETCNFYILTNIENQFWQEVISEEEKRVQAKESLISIGSLFL